MTTKKAAPQEESPSGSEGHIGSPSAPSTPPAGAAPTPRTDHAFKGSHLWSGFIHDFARKLERELAEANQHKRDLQEHLRAAEAARPPLAARPSEEAVKLAKEFVADPDARAKVKVELALAGCSKIPDMMDEAVVMARELLRLDALAKGRDDQEPAHR